MWEVKIKEMYVEKCLCDPEVREDLTKILKAQTVGIVYLIQIKSMFNEGHNGKSMDK